MWGLRAAGLGSVKGVILGREKGVALGCDLTKKDFFNTIRGKADIPPRGRDFRF
jgi:hypothetical protein